MTTVFDVALYFLHSVDRESGYTISPLKLQKLVYYAQAWSLVFRNKVLFDEPIEAWVNGPVVPALWREYKEYERETILEPSLPSPNFSPDEEEVLSEVWKTYGDLSAGKLYRLTHSEQPWINARGNLAPSEKSQEHIFLEDMKSYYSNFVKQHNSGISSDALQVEKVVKVSVTLKSGCTVQVPISEIEDFLIENSGNLKTQRYKRKGPPRKVNSR